MPTYHYPAVTVDVAVLNWNDPDLTLLLIQRRNPPFQGHWALPGGFIEEHETLEASALRELEEETSLTPITLHQVGAWGNPGRDPRGRTISIVFRSLLFNFQGEVQGRDDALVAQWFSLQDLPDLAFDHGEIVQGVLADLGHELQCHNQENKRQFPDRELLLNRLMNT